MCADTQVVSQKQILKVAQNQINSGWKKKTMQRKKKIASDGVITPPRL